MSHVIHLRSLLFYPHSFVDHDFPRVSLDSYFGTDRASLRAHIVTVRDST